MHVCLDALSGGDCGSFQDRGGCEEGGGLMVG